MLIECWVELMSKISGVHQIVYLCSTGFENHSILSSELTLYKSIRIMTFLSPLFLEASLPFWLCFEEQAIITLNQISRWRQGKVFSFLSSIVYGTPEVFCTWVAHHPCWWIFVILQILQTLYELLWWDRRNRTGTTEEIMPLTFWPQSPWKM